MTHDEEAVEQTVMLTRRARRSAGRDAVTDAGTGATADAGSGATADAESDAVDDHTVVIDRGVDDHTVVIDRGVDDHTVVIDRGVDERTVVLDRPGRSAARTAATRSSSTSTTDASSETPDLDVAPPPTASETVVQPAIYKPRPAPLVPSRPPTVTTPIVATRTLDSTLVSVEKRGRRISRNAVVAFGGACIVSVAGLALLAVTTFA